MRHIQPKESFRIDNEKAGVYSFVVSPSEVDYCGIDLNKLYGRDNLCLKVFVAKMKPLKDFTWGGYNSAYQRSAAENNFYNCTRVQNLAALYGYAPRVYAIVTTEFRGKKVYAQVTDYMEQTEETDPDNEKFNEMREALEKYGVSIPRGLDSSPRNFVGGKFVDFQMFSINDKKFREYVKKVAHDKTDWGSKDYSYETVPGLIRKGQRDTKRRAKVLGLDTFDFVDKTVLDVGCSTGSFSRIAARNGAKIVVGVDVGSTPLAAAEISIYLGDFNIDYYQINLWDELKTLEEYTGITLYDVVLFLSVHHQIGYQSKYINRIAKDYFFLEGHSADQEETYRPLLKKDFKQVTYKGRMRNNARPAFVCQK